MSSMKSTTWIYAASAFVVAASAGCGSSDTAAATTSGTGTPTTTTTGTTQPGTPTELKIAMIAKSSSNPVFLAARTGAEAAAKDLGDKNHVKISIDWRTPSDEDAQVQASRIAQAVNDGDNVVLLSCSDAAKVTGAINDAVGKGVSVMTFDSDAPDSKRFAFYGADDDACGRQVMDELGPIMGGKGSYAILAGNQNAPNLQKRVKGVEAEAAAKFPGMKLVSVFYHKETPEDAAAAVTQAMNANPQITGWAMVGGWPLFTKSLLSLDPTKCKIVAVDALPAELPYIEKGIAPVLLAQPVYDWGYKSVGIIVDKLVLHKDVQAVNKMDLVKVDKSDLGIWAQKLQTWGFTDLDPKYLALAKPGAPDKTPAVGNGRATK
jgi:ribose transport system substrate-binding protein